MSKTWEAVDVSKENTVINLIEIDGDPAMQVRQRYIYLDGNGDEISDLSDQYIEEKRKLSNVPQNMKDAINQIRNFMYNKALDEEGLS